MPKDIRLFTSLVFVVNRSATNHDRAQRLNRQFKKVVKSNVVSEIDITGFDKDRTRDVIERIAKKFTDKTVVAIAGGDGTVSRIIEIIVTSTALSPENKRAVLIPMWGGNANDLAIMLNGQITRTTIKDVLDKARVVAVYPLHIKLTQSDGVSSTHIATCYASFGITAQASWLMDTVSHAHAHDGTAPKSFLMKIIREQVDFWKTAFRIDGFVVRVDDSKEERMYERIFINGPRIARISRIPVKLTDKKYFEASANKKGLHFVLFTFKTFLRQNYGTVTDEHQRFLIKDATMAQIDGETIGVQSHTHVEVSISGVPVSVLSSRLS